MINRLSKVVMYKYISTVLLIFLLISKLSTFSNLVRVNYLGLRLSQVLSNYSSVDLWNASEKWSDQGLKAELEQLHMSCTSDSQSLVVSYLRGLCGWVVGDLKLAHQSFKQAQNIRPGLARLFDGRVYDCEGEEASAASSWESDDIHSYLLNTAYHWRLQGYFKRAVDLYEVMYTNRMDTLDAKLILMTAYLDAQDYRKTREMIDLILLQDPQNFAAQSVLVHVLAFGEGHYEAALELGGHLLADPKLSEEQRAGLYQKLGKIERQIGNTQTAIEYFVQYRDLPVTSDWYGNYFIAQTYRMDSRLKEALESINLALSTTPNRSLCLTERGFIYLQMGDVELALQDFDLAIQLDPNNIGRRTLIVNELNKTRTLTIACDILQGEARVAGQNIIQILPECHK